MDRPTTHTAVRPLLQTAVLLALLLAALVGAGCGGEGAPSASPAPEQDAAQPASASQIHVMNGWIRAVPPSSPNSAAFFMIHNGGADNAIVGASAGIAGAVELHTHTQVGERMEMRQVDRIELPADGHVSLEPGGLHIMFIGLTAPLVEGAMVPLQLQLADGQRMDLSLPVRRATPGAGDSTHGHGHH